jgi:hypothetical protein
MVPTTLITLICAHVMVQISNPQFYFKTKHLKLNRFPLHLQSIVDPSLIKLQFILRSLFYFLK